MKCAFSMHAFTLCAIFMCWQWCCHEELGVDFTPWFWRQEEPNAFSEQKYNFWNTGWNADLMRDTMKIHRMIPMGKIFWWIWLSVQIQLMLTFYPIGRGKVWQISVDSLWVGVGIYAYAKNITRAQSPILSQEKVRSLVDPAFAVKNQCSYFNLLRARRFNRTQHELSDVRHM